MMSHSEALKHKLLTLPSEPGCYLMKDEEGTIIYVGKAKRLKSRVNSYFSSKVHNYKTTKLVSAIVDFEYIITSSEKEALILENNLIKKHRPRFNILMMDDKTYPYLRLTAEEHPRLRVVRDVKDKKAKHFGPFSDSTAAYSVMKLLNRIYPLRKCVHLPKQPCLYYHMKQCLAPCILPVSQETYQEITAKIERFLKGDTKEVMDQLREQMQQAAEQMEYERAKELRDLMANIEHINDRQRMETSYKRDMDIFAYVVDHGYISIQGLLVRSGKLLERAMNVFELHDDEQEAFLSFLMQYYEHNPLPQDLLLPEEVDCSALEGVFDVKLVQPQRGEKNKLMELARHNATKQLQQQFEVAYQKLNRNVLAMKQLSALLQLPSLMRLEMFDNSHLSGTNRVSGMIVVEQGEFKKAAYRTFKIKGDSVDDIGMMREVLYRRYFRLLKEGKEMPDLIVMDGGIQQIHVCQEILDSLGLTIPICGLAKDDKHKTANILNQQGIVLDIDRTSELFYFLTRLQDEVHRFAITFHQNQRSKSMKDSVLDQIEGIGEQRKKKLMRQFKSVKQMREATVDQLAEVVGQRAAGNVYRALHEDNDENV